MNADGEEPLSNDAESSLIYIPSKICSTFRNSYIILDDTVVCYCCIIIVLSSLLSCVLPSVRVIGKEYQGAQLSELSRIPHRPKCSRAGAAGATRRAGTWCVKHKAWCPGLGAYTAPGTFAAPEYARCGSAASAVFLKCGSLTGHPSRDRMR